jgi:hypothetical protein
MSAVTGNTVGLWGVLNYRGCTSPSVGVAMRRIPACEVVVGEVQIALDAKIAMVLGQNVWSGQMRAEGKLI